MQPGIERKARSATTLSEKGTKRGRILLIDPRPLTRASIARLLEANLSAVHIETLPDTTTLADSAASRLGVELVIMNLGSAGASELRVARDIDQLRRTLPDIPVVFVSDRDAFDDVIEGLRLGARGFVPTSLDLPVLVQAVRIVQAGGTFIPATTLTELLRGRRAADATRSAPTQGLTARQVEILALLRQGKSNKMIGHALALQESTVKVHLRRIMKKLNAVNRTQAVFLAEQILNGMQQSGAGEPLRAADAARAGGD